jgi:hypothetical protein
VQPGIDTPLSQLPAAKTAKLRQGLSVGCRKNTGYPVLYSKDKDNEALVWFPEQG